MILFKIEGSLGVIMKRCIPSINSLFLYIFQMVIMKTKEHVIPMSSHFSYANQLMYTNDISFSSFSHRSGLYLMI